MFRKIIIAPYRSLSHGATSLRDKLRTTLPRQAVNKTIVDAIDWMSYSASNAPAAYRNTLFVNWGTQGDMRNVSRDLNFFNNGNRILNPNLRPMSNKAQFFRRMSEQAETAPMIPFWTIVRGQAIEFLQSNPNSRLAVRATVVGSGGYGLSIFNSETTPIEALPDAPLYVQYIPKKHEFRAHIFRDLPIVYQQKKLRRGTENPNFEIRNLDNNWIYARDNIVVPNVVRALAGHFQRVSRQLDWLDFGALDIIYNEMNNRAYALEVNTSPGLEGQTLDDYAENILSVYRSNTDALDAVVNN